MPGLLGPQEASSKEAPIGSHRKRRLAPELDLED